MIVATYKCGCPPKAENGKPCSPCCTSGRKIDVKRPVPSGCPASPCCKKQCLQSVQVPKIEEPSRCCPTKPSDGSEFLTSRKVRSEIAEKGLPYKELEAVINDNRVIIRTQKEAVKEEYDPPCECIEDSEPGGQDAKESVRQVQNSGNKTVTLYPRPRRPDTESQDMENGDDDETLTDVKLPQQEENPNIFLLRVRKNYNEGEKRYNIDLEFKTPRPWSLQKRLEYEERVGRLKK